MPGGWQNSAQKPTDRPVANGLMHLQIPTLAIDASVETVGLTAEGAMDTPTDSANVAWYSLGVRPGEVGSAVIDGHLDSKGGQPAVFAKLAMIKPGDILSILEGNHATVFVVRIIQAYAELASAADVFASSDGKSHLNLITCEGTWNSRTRSYSERLVVFADKTLEKPTD